MLGTCVVRCVESCVMSHKASLFPLAAAGVTAFALVAAIFVLPDFASAGEVAAKPGCACPTSTNRPAIRPRLVESDRGLDDNDEIAALESLQYALTEVADGSSYVWHRSHGRLSGIVKPLSSFKDTHGGVCRHAAVVLSAVDETKRTELVACRLATGVWQVEG